jgi:hypothetical protein
VKRLWATIPVVYRNKAGNWYKLTLIYILPSIIFKGTVAPVPSSLEMVWLKRQGELKVLIFFNALSILVYKKSYSAAIARR